MSLTSVINALELQYGDVNIDLSAKLILRQNCILAVDYLLLNITFWGMNDYMYFLFKIDRSCTFSIIINKKKTY